jgi:RNA recognition motif. (a.k.a. RRM, RBD, or RNP domain)
MRDPHEGVSRGFGFVNFTEPSSAEASLQLDGTEVQGKALVVQRAKRQVLWSNLACPYTNSRPVPRSHQRTPLRRQIRSPRPVPSRPRYMNLTQTTTADPTMTAWTEDTTEATTVATIRETATRAKTDTGTRTETPHVVIQGTTEILVMLHAAIPETPETLETLETHHAAILEMPHDASTMTHHHDTETTPRLYDTETTRRLIRVDGDRNHGQETYKVASVLQLTFTFSYTIHIAFQFTDHSYGFACLSDSDRFRLSDALTPQITFQYSDVNNASVQ